jgi:hypothetical protein
MSLNLKENKRFTVFEKTVLRRILYNMRGSNRRKEVFALRGAS